MSHKENLGGDAPNMVTKKGARSSWASFQPGVPALTRLPTDSHAVDAYRLLALKLEDRISAGAEHGFLLSITGPEPDVGKTLTTVNLALALAKKGERRVIAVEGDFWRPSLRKLLRLDPSTPGLNELLREGSGVDLNDIISSVWSSGIDVITIGNENRFDGELPSSAIFRDLAVRLRSMYDVVVFDSPPIYLSGGAVLAKMADGVLVVVRARKTKRQSIEKLLQEVPPASCLGLVLNDVRAEAEYYDSYYRRRT